MEERARAVGGSGGHSDDGSGGHSSGSGGGGGGAQASPGVVPAGQRCVWPGCTRRRAAGRSAGSGRQKEYCLQADSPEAGGGPVHNARNRWAALRSASHRAALEATGSADGDGYGGLGDGPDSVGHPRTAMGGREEAAIVPDQLPYSAAKKRASDLLEQARRQHAAAIASLQAERELYQRLGEQLTALTDPGALDLELAAIASRAGAAVAQAEEDGVRARRAQLTAERERDDAVRLRGHADAAAEQLASDAEAAEAALAERTAAFDRDRAALLERARDADGRADRARVDAAAARTAAEQAAVDAAASVSEAREHAATEIGQAQARADEAIAQARRAAEEAAAQARRQSAEQVTAAMDRAREQVAGAEARADAQTDRARRDVDAARRETATAIADASAATERARAEALAARDASAGAAASAANASARADASAAEAERARAEIGRLREELRRLDAAHDAEVGRLTAAHQAALDAERARAARAETELDAMRGTAS